MDNGHAKKPPFPGIDSRSNAQSDAREAWPSGAVPARDLASLRNRLQRRDKLYGSEKRKRWPGQESSRRRLARGLHSRGRPCRMKINPMQLVMSPSPFMSPKSVAGWAAMPPRQCCRAKVPMSGKWSWRTSASRRAGGGSTLETSRRSFRRREGRVPVGWHEVGRIVLSGHLPVWHRTQKN